MYNHNIVYIFSSFSLHLQNISDLKIDEQLFIVRTTLKLHHNAFSKYCYRPNRLFSLELKLMCGQLKQAMMS